MRDIDLIFERLSRSKFRSGFKLKAKELGYLNERGMDTVLLHASEFIQKRLAPAYPENDGKQTPYGKHPAFVAQHATGTCCRSCLEKWHGIKKGRELSEKQVNYIVSVIEKWLRNQLN